MHLSYEQVEIVHRLVAYVVFTGANLFMIWAFQNLVLGLARVDEEAKHYTKLRELIRPVMLHTIVFFTWIPYLYTALPKEVIEPNFGLWLFCVPLFTTVSLELVIVRKKIPLVVSASFLGAVQISSCAAFSVMHILSANGLASLIDRLHTYQ